MGDNFHNGEKKQCNKCGSIYYLFDKETLTNIERVMGGEILEQVGGDFPARKTDRATFVKVD